MNPIHDVYLELDGRVDGEDFIRIVEVSMKDAAVAIIEYEKLMLIAADKLEDWVDAYTDKSGENEDIIRRLRETAK